VKSVDESFATVEIASGVVVVVKDTLIALSTLT
jgi:hypothetical protein